MSNPLASRASSLPDHMTDDGNRVAIQIIINVHASGALSVQAPLEDKAWCLAALEQAKDAVRNWRAGGLIVPSSDVDGRVKL